MKVARLLCAALALMLISGLTTRVQACDKNKATASAAAHAITKAITKATVAVAASEGMICTPEMMAACKASMAAGGPDLCTGKSAGAAAAAANPACCAKGMKISAAVASPIGDHCAMAKANAAAAVNGASTSNTVYLAGANGTCPAHTKTIGASAGGQCSGHGMASMAAVNGHEDCEACEDMADCSGALDAASAHRQTVRLKNGIMYVYTADSPRNVSAVQAAVAHRVERLSRFVAAGDKARLCAECKAMRGAMASGKLNREVVNIEGGSLTLLTSNDPAVVAKIHAMASDQKVAARIKS